MIPTKKGEVLFNAPYTPLTRLEEIENNFQNATEKHRPTISIGMCFETLNELYQ